MHGATLLDSADRPLRPAILWNDGRSGAECEVLERREPRSRAITGNLAMPGFTAPKLLWLREHEPEHFRALRHVLLPKDYLRLRMTGDHASDVSDSSGTLWLDVAERRWSDAMLAACDLDLGFMPALVEGSDPTGTLRADVAERWGCERVPVAGGGGDQAAGALGVGVVLPGQASLSLGTSGVFFVAGDRFRPNPEGAVHAFCHCVPNTWHQMSVILSAASCLSWVSRLTGAESEAALLAEIESVDRPCERLLFLPYLSGERTPHNDPTARGVFFGLDHDTDRAELGRAVLEGVAFAFADGQAALQAAQAQIADVSVIGGGARSQLWGEILASALGRPLIYREGGNLGPAHGAARLARLCATGESVSQLCHAPPVAAEIEPQKSLHDHYAERLPRYRELYQALRPAFRAAAGAPPGDPQ
jgi:xylulokinase